MSVLACNRARCENVMCDRYSHKYGYLCRDCFEELVLYMSIVKAKNGQIDPVHYEFFMKTFVGAFKQTNVDATDECAEEFEERYRGEKE